MSQNIDINPKSLDPRILVLAAASFAMGTEAYVYVGHLEPLSRDLGIGIAQAGMLAASFAITYAISAPLIASLTSRIDRRRLIVTGLGAIGILNLAAAFAPSFLALLSLRIACGLAAALVGPAASAAAAALAPPARRGRAMVVVLAGMTLAFILGIPLGSVVGAYAGWRATFAFAGIVALLAALGARLVLPRIAGADAAGFRGLSVAFQPEILRTLSLTVLGFAATFTVIAYIGPVAALIAGVQGSGVGALQALIGVGSILGIAVGARYADRPDALRLVIASFAVSGTALCLYSLLPVAGLDDPLILPILSLAMVCGAAALFARTPVIQVRLVNLAPESTGVLLALNGSMVFVGQGLGAAAGAVTIAMVDLTALGFVAAIIALGGMVVATRAVERTTSSATYGRHPS